MEIIETKKERVICDICGKDFAKSWIKTHKKKCEQKKLIIPSHIGFVYKISNTKNNLIYIGSTIQRLSKRWHEHKIKGDTRSQVLFELCGKENCSFERIEEFKIPLTDITPENFLIELHKREEFHIRLNRRNCINVSRAYRTEEDRKQDKKDWEEANRDHIRELQKARRERVKEELGLPATTLYYRENPEKAQAQLDKKRERVKCPHCESVVSKNNMSRHIKQYHPQQLP